MRSIIAFLLIFVLQSADLAKLKHGIKLYFSSSYTGHIEGKHVAIISLSELTPVDSKVDGEIDGDIFLGYNLQSTNFFSFSRGFFDYDFHIGFKRQFTPKQTNQVRRADGLPTIASLPPVDSPNSYIHTIDLYFGMIYTFPKLGKFYYYLGLGVHTMNGYWHRSYYNPDNSELDYGEKGKTKSSGYGLSMKGGIKLTRNWSIELEFGQYLQKADSFRSFNFNGLEMEYTSLGLSLIYFF